MKKQGFSILELMVTVLILGVLAAIAVPKLFGLFDKSKAAEIALAAGTYIKMQDTYVSEHVKAGSWQSIGYKSPAGNATGKASTSNFTYDAAQTTYNWTAEATISLNECSKGKKWFINHFLEAGSHDIKYWASSDDVGNCMNALTPNFSKLSNTATAITSPGQAE
ncbi:MAG: type II secretion system protein [Fibrobacter sp.]|nr:type II secretion system protein [Fibrobacter sp.]